MEALILLADGFEQSEALITHDIFTRSHFIHPVLASIHDREEVTSSMGLRVKADVLLKDIDLSAFDFLVLPGGKRGVENLFADARVVKAIAFFKENGKDVHAICAAPSILGRLGYLKAPYTCYPGFETMEGHTGEGVVKAGTQITGKGMGFTTEFALEIVALYGGDEAKEKIRASIRGS